MLHKFTHNGSTFEISVPEGMTPSEAQHAHLINVDPGYLWTEFRRALIDSDEYALSIALSNQNQALAVADAKLGLAIDCCFAHRGSAPEVAACRSALALYLSALPSTTEGQAVAARLTALMEEYGI